MSAPTQIKLPFSNDGSFMEQFMKMQQEQQKSQQPDSTAEPSTKDTALEPSKQDSQASASTAEATAAAVDDAPKKDQQAEPEQPAASNPAEPEADNSPFIASKTFTGAKAGYVFKTDSEGTGYYLDTKEALQPRKPSKAKPAVLKTNNPIVKIQPKMSAAESRKRKLEEDSKPRYLRELDRYKSMACGSDTKHDRPLVK